MSPDLAGLWAMHAPSLRALLADRHRARALNAPWGEAVPDAGAPGPWDDEPLYSLRGGVAVVPLAGPLHPGRSLMEDVMGRVLGGTNLARFARAVSNAAADPQARALLLDVDSPGGQVAGTAEAAAAVRAAGSAKPVWAHADHYGASAAYWISSAAGRLLAAPTAQLGSIGVVFRLEDCTPMLERLGIRTGQVISSQSPHKWADPFTDHGRLLLQKVADEVAAVFVEDVARHRRTTPEAVLSDFGGGDVLVGRDALDAGMCDGLGTLEAALAELQEQARPAASAARVTFGAPARARADSRGGSRATFGA